jgi:hypothetical protein
LCTLADVGNVVVNCGCVGVDPVYSEYTTVYNNIASVKKQCKENLSCHLISMLFGHHPESIKLLWFIEDQAFLKSYGSAPRLTLSSQQVFSLSWSSCVSSVELTNWRGGKRSYDREKTWPSIKHAILSGHYRVLYFCLLQARVRKLRTWHKLYFPFVLDNRL